MAIAFKCAKCQKPYKVKDEMAGKRVVCKACNTATTVPAPVAKAATDHPEAEDLALAALAEESVNSSDAAAEGTFSTECPNCLETVEFPLKMAGKQAPCSACRRIVRVPQPADHRKKDWRVTEKPAAARVDKEHIEGAWGNTTHGGIVSRDALLEAAVIKSRKDRDLTLGQKVTRGVIGLSILALGAVGFLLWRGHQADKARDGLMDKAMELVKGNANLPPFARSATFRVAAEYALRGRKPDVEQARKFLEEAANYPPAEAPDEVLERALALYEVGVAACGLRGPQAAWEPADFTTLQRTFAAFGPNPLGRDGGVLAVARGTAKLAPPAADRPDGPRLANYAFGNDAPNDAAEARAAAGLELLTTADAANALADQVADAAAQSPRAVALLVALKRPVPAVPPPGQGEPPFLARVGYAEGYARRGEAETARNVVALPGRFEDRFAAAAAVADATDTAADAQTAVDLLTKEIGERDLPEWPLVRLAYACAALKEAEPGRALAAFLTTWTRGTPRQQAVRAWSIALQMRAGHTALDASVVKTLPQSSAGAVLAYEALARRDAPADVTTWPEAAKPAGLAASALGLLERK